jgi:hypothetical protein
MKIIISLYFICIHSVFAGGYLDEGGKLSQTTKWTKYTSVEKRNLKFLLLYLAKSNTGRELIRKANQKAKSYGQTLYDVIKPGSGSITDTTLIRRFSQKNPDDISYESRSKVYINNQLNQHDALLDLAHELTHFVFRKSFNPYDTKFTLPQFIASTVEGEGGEVHAFMTECRVLQELFPDKLQTRYNCKKIISTYTGKISKELAVKKFYSIGPYYQKFKHKLDLHGIADNFPFISQEEVGFVSSAYGMPYPIAAYHEYRTVISKVCENDKRRISYMKVGDKGRTPASISQIKKDYLDRCSSLE